MDVSISPDEVLAALQRDFPREYRIACLTVLCDDQARQITELQRTQAAEALPAAPAEV